MAQITASLVKELREKTGAGMMDCKKALGQTDGDLQKAIDFLREKGLAQAAKKADRVAAEGLVAVASGGNKAVAIELNSETDFVARNDQFQELAAGIAKAALTTDGEVESVRNADFGGKTVAESVTDAVAKIGENINLRRSAALEVQEGVVASYVHNKVVEGAGKIGVLVALKSSAADKDALNAIGKQIAMHVAAAKPEAVRRADVNSDSIDKERAIYAAQLKEEGKPEQIIPKIVEGKIEKFYSQVVLPEQVFVIDGKATVTEFLAEKGKELGADIEIQDFVSFVLGEGIEKREENFAEEVAKAANV